MKRISRHEWGLQLAEATALRSTCLRRAVGCVLVDRGGYVLATGYNGVPGGRAHCNEAQRVFEISEWLVGENDIFPHACPGASAPSGTDLEGCQAIHAEVNACLQCADVQKIGVCYVTASPCVACVKMLLNTGCEEIVFRSVYPHPSSRQIWQSPSQFGFIRKWTLLESER